MDHRVPQMFFKRQFRKLLEVNKMLKILRVVEQFGEKLSFSQLKLKKGV